MFFIFKNVLPLQKLSFCFWFRCELVNRNPLKEKSTRSSVYIASYSYAIFFFFSFCERLVAVTFSPASILWLCLIDWVEGDQPDVCVRLCLCVRLLFSRSKTSVLQVGRFCLTFQNWPQTTMIVITDCFLVAEWDVFLTVTSPAWLQNHPLWHNRFK